MTYALTFVADMGSANTGLTIRAQLYDSDGTPNGAELTADMVEVDSTNAPGVYAYRATMPDNHDGIFAMYNNADKTQRVTFAVNPVEAEINAFADSVWDELRAEHTTTLTFGAVSEWAPITAGSGSVSHTIQIVYNSAPVDGAEVWVTTDVAGANTIAGTLSTNAQGNVTFLLDTGTYYAWVRKSGFNFTNPTGFTVS